MGAPTCLKIDYPTCLKRLSVILLCSLGNLPTCEVSKLNTFPWSGATHLRGDEIILKTCELVISAKHLHHSESQLHCERRAKRIQPMYQKIKAKAMLGNEGWTQRTYVVGQISAKTKEIDFSSRKDLYKSLQNTIRTRLHFNSVGKLTYINPLVVFRRSCDLLRLTNTKKCETSYLHVYTWKITT